MAKEYPLNPDPAMLLDRINQLQATVLGLAESLLKHGNTVGDLSKDVEALRRGAGEVNQVRKKLEELEKLGAPAAAPEDEEEAKKAKKTQPDWLNIPREGGLELAQGWIEALIPWTEETFPRATGKKLPPCWLWHPRAVVYLLAMKAHRDAVYATSPQAAPTVSDYLARFEDIATKRLLGAGGNGVEAGVLLACVRAGEHQDPGMGATNAELRQASEYVAWWVDGGRGLSPGLTKVESQ